MTPRSPQNPTGTVSMTYSSILTAGVLTGTLVSLLLGSRKRIPPSVVMDGVLAAGMGGIAVGRALYVLAHPAYFQEHPAETLAFWRGGLSGFGTVAGGLVGILLLSARRRQEPWRLMNLLAPGAAVVVVAAWAGCLRAGCAWGRETWPAEGLLWRLSMDLPDLYGLRAPRVPVQLMGALWGVFLLLLSSLGWRLRWRNVGGLWLLLYGLGDLALSFFRGDLPAGPGGLSPLQWADLGLCAGALLTFLGRIRRAY